MLKIQENNYLPLLGGRKRSYGGKKSRKKSTKKSRKKSTKKSRKKSTKKSRKKSRKKPKHHHIILNKFKNFNDKIIEDCSKLDTHKKEIKIGEGTQGIIDEISIDNTTYIRKSYKLLSDQNKYDFYSEVYALMDLQGIKYTPINFNKKIPQEEYEECLKLLGIESKGEYNAVPTLYAAFTCNNVGYIIMNKMNKCFHAFLSHLATETETKKMYAMLCCLYSIQQKLIPYGWLHVDTHIGNIACNKIRTEPVLIDFGWAVYNPDYDTRNPRCNLF